MRAFRAGILLLLALLLPTAAAVGQLLLELQQQEQTMLIVVTHSLELAAMAVVTGERLCTVTTPVPSDIWEQPMLTHVRTLLAVGSPDALAHASELLMEGRVRVPQA